MNRYVQLYFSTDKATFDSKILDPIHFAKQTRSPEVNTWRHPIDTFAVKSEWQTGKPQNT